MISQIYEIYSVPNYFEYVLEKNDKGSKIAERFASKSYKKIIEELETNDKQYQLNVCKDDMLKLNIDIDGMKRKKLPTFFNRISKYFASIGVTEDLDVSYTKNNNGEKILHRVLGLALNPGWYHLLYLVSWRPVHQPLHKIFCRLARPR